MPPIRQQPKRGYFWLFHFDLHWFDGRRHFSDLASCFYVESEAWLASVSACPGKTSQGAPGGGNSYQPTRAICRLEDGVDVNNPAGPPTQYTLASGSLE